MTTKLSLPFIHLPQYYTKLLMGNSHSSPDFFNKTMQYIYDTPVLLGLVRAFIMDPASQIPLDAQLKAMGWLGIRDRLTLVFLEREWSGRFCHPTDQTRNAMAEMLEFEKRARDISVEGYSRSFLLAFYFKVIQIRQKGEMSGGEKIFGMIPRPLLQMLLEVKARAIRIDWLFLFCLHLYQYRGPEKFKELIKNSGTRQNVIGTVFTKVWPASENELTDEIIRNLLCYGASIGEQDFFCSSLVGGTQRSREGDTAST
ncbi:MAG: hypothetical protein A2X86_02615 [Bdellovibrionales bacterium GWA2_49_15]|nr:MAG: hypothetical protein A2X86_02615 [Bdellovibrionales bacterium GWA2_49_15]